ncbi:MAG: carboxylating nicotinate-nucleotide diphosphorylase [Pseudomonadota bacterium]
MSSPQPSARLDAALHGELVRSVEFALAEDIGKGDLTAGLIPASARASAQVITREPAILCGQAWFSRCFTELDPECSLRWQAQDGDAVAAGALLCTLEGSARALLSGERSGLNFLQLLSGVASKTQTYVDALRGSKTRVVDTRKTIPGLRLAQKYAVKCGGGENHRLGLYDAILIKENHILAAGGIAAALAAAQQIAAESADRCRFIQVEVESLEQLDEALNAGASMILLDNMGLDSLRQAVNINAGRALLEASGNVHLATLRAIADTGVDRISIGELTKHLCAIDLSLRLVTARV